MTGGACRGARPAPAPESVDEPVWLAALDELLRAARRGEVRRIDESLPLAAVVEELVLGAPRRYTRPEVLVRAGLGQEEGRRLWRSLGFPEVDDADALFTARDVEAAGLMTQLAETGILTPDVREAVVRAVAQSMSRLAEWQVDMIRQLVADQPEHVSPRQAVELAAAILPMLETLQNYVWRRHLAATATRAVLGRDESARTVPLTVGFADMVGFTRTTRRRSTTELGEMIERFGSSTTEVIAGGGGRIVKTVGDEVLFVADDVAAAAIALELQERARSEPLLPALRIGLATGEVLVRFGDVYGEVVNIAARLTAHAQPDRVVVDQKIADVLAGDPRFGIRPMRPVRLRGYRRLKPFRLSRTEQRR